MCSCYFNNLLCQRNDDEKKHQLDTLLTFSLLLDDIDKTYRLIVFICCRCGTIMLPLQP